MALKPSLVNLPVFTTTANTLDLPSYLGYINATPTANATYKLPVLESYSSGAWAQIKNQSIYTITINDINDNNVGQIPANGVGEYISSSIGWIDYSVNPEGVINSDTNITGYLNVGSAGPPLNTAPGYVTASRLRLGTPWSTDSGAPIFVQEIGSAAMNLIRLEGVSLTASPGTNCVILNSTLTNAGATGTFGNYIGLSTALTHNAPVSVVNMHGITSQINTGSNFTTDNIANMNAFRCTIAHSGAGTITSLNGLVCSMTTTGGTIGTYVGLNVSGSTSALVTTKAGLKIGGFTNGTNNYGIWMASNTTDVGSGMAFGLTPDTYLWRGAINQLLTPGDWMLRHVLCSSVPTVSAGAGAGSSPTISITGTDHGFTVTLTTGTTATINATLFTVTFGATWTSSAPSVSFGEGNATTAAIAVAARPFVSATTTTTMTFTSNNTALSDSTTYIWRFTANR